MNNKHDFNGDPEWAVTDAEDDVGLDVVAKHEVPNHSNWNVDQEQNLKRIGYYLFLIFNFNYLVMYLLLFASFFLYVDAYCNKSIDTYLCKLY